VNAYQWGPQGPLTSYNSLLLIPRARSTAREAQRRRRPMAIRWNRVGLGRRPANA